MLSVRDNIEIMIYYNADENIEELSESLINRYQIVLETSITGTDFLFLFDCVTLLNCKYYKINPKRG